MWARAVPGRAAPACTGQAVGALQAHPWRGAAELRRRRALAEHAALRRACTGGWRAAAAARRGAAAKRRGAAAIWRAAAALAGRRPGARGPLAARRAAAALAGCRPSARRRPRLQAASARPARMPRPARGPLRGCARAWCTSCGAAALPAHARRRVRLSAALPGGRRGRGIHCAALYAAVGHGAGGRSRLALCRARGRAGRHTGVGMRAVRAVALRLPVGAGGGAGRVQARLVRRPDRLHHSCAQPLSSTGG